LVAAEIHHHSVESKLDEFIGIVESAIRVMLDGRRVRGMNFDWKPKKALARTRHVRSRFPEEKLKTKEPSYDEIMLTRVAMLSKAELRDFLINLAKVGKARSSDAAAISNETITKPLLDGV